MWFGFFDLVFVVSWVTLLPGYDRYVSIPSAMYYAAWHHWGLVTGDDAWGLLRLKTLLTLGFKAQCLIKAAWNQVSNTHNITHLYIDIYDICFVNEMFMHCVDTAANTLMYCHGVLHFVLKLLVQLATRTWELQSFIIFVLAEKFGIRTTSCFYYYFCCWVFHSMAETYIQWFDLKY